MTKRYNKRSLITLHLNYMKDYCTLYSTKGSNPVSITHVVDNNSELFFLSQFETLANKMLIPSNSVKFVLDKVLALLLSKKFAISVDPKIIDMQRELDKKMYEPNNKSSVEINFGSKVSKGMPIPAFRERVFMPTQRALFFYQEAKRYRYKTVEQAEFCNMKNHYGLFDSMTTEQKNWYFFWRGKVRLGEYPKTAVTYINIYIYELINSIGVSDAQDGFNKIADLWINYKSDFPFLDEYVGKWLIDYSIIHNLDGVEAVFEKIDFEWKSNEIDILLSKIENKLDLLGKFNVINFYSTYKITKSSYYLKCKHKDLVKKKVETAFAAVENYFLDKFSYSICDKYSPYYSTRTVQAPFVGALYAGTKMIDVKYKSYSGNPDFKYFLAQIVRYTEKLLRLDDNYRTPLQKVDLTDNIKAIIETALDISTNQKQRPKKIVMDMTKINNLIKDSDEMQRLLIDTSVGEDEAILQPSHENIIEKIQPVSAYEGGNLLDNFFSLLSDCQREVMEILISKKDYGRINEIAALNNTISSKIFDDINELALETVNDIIIDTTGDVLEIIGQYADDCAQCLIK